MHDGLPEPPNAVEVELPNGAVALVQVRELDPDVAEKVGWPERFRFEEVADAVEGIANALHSAVAKVRPKKVTVELGFELAVKSGKLVGMLVEGEGRGSLTVTLEWEHAREPGSGQ